MARRNTLTRSPNGVGLLCFLALFCLAGWCHVGLAAWSGSVEDVTLTGVVAGDGQHPVTGGTVFLVRGSEQMASAPIGVDGSYQLRVEHVRTAASSQFSLSFRPNRLEPSYYCDFDQSLADLGIADADAGSTMAVPRYTWPLGGCLHIRLVWQNPPSTASANDAIVGVYGHRPAGEWVVTRGRRDLYVGLPAGPVNRRVRVSPRGGDAWSSLAPTELGLGETVTLDVTMPNDSNGGVGSDMRGKDLSAVDLSGMADAITYGI